jgi:hypothetical protein
LSFSYRYRDTSGERERYRDTSGAFGLKSRNPDFTKEIGNTDIVILQETWYRGDGPTGCPLGYMD